MTDINLPSGTRVNVVRVPGWIGVQGKIVGITATESYPNFCIYLVELDKPELADGSKYPVIAIVNGCLELIEEPYRHPWGNGKSTCEICGKDCDGHYGEGWG